MKAYSTRSVPHLVTVKAYDHYLHFVQMAINPTIALRIAEQKLIRRGIPSNNCESSSIDYLIKNLPQLKPANRYNLAQVPDNCIWSNTALPIPAIGDKVSINFNGLGAGIVAGYFTEDGENRQYLGVYVKLDNPPNWWVKQNPDRAYAMVFGAELRSL